MFQRPHLQVLSERIAESRKRIQMVVGPRQTGKTTLVTQLLGQWKGLKMLVSADAVSGADGTWLQQQWEIARLQSGSEGQEFLLVIDEVQKVSQWSEWVKKQWDKDTREGRNIKLILLGSSRLLLQQGLTESLAGRFELLYVGHWSFPEMREAFGWTIQQYIWFGGYPGSANLIEDEDRWKAYVRDSLIESSISRDILMMTRVDKPALMKRLFELGCLYSGQILSYTKLMGQLQDAGNTTTLAHYLGLLETAGLLSGLDKYAADVVRQRSSSPKFQVFNNALISAQRPDHFADVMNDPAAWGRMVESAVGAHLLNVAAAKKIALNYWREGGNEVDFVVQKGKQCIAIEVKSNMSSTGKGMQIFNDKFHPNKILLVADTGIPVGQFLAMDPDQWWGR
ncbi:MAG: ATP-binding protein [Sphingobacteriales bacterium]